jgi:hypothetical protein
MQCRTALHYESSRRVGSLQAFHQRRETAAEAALVRCRTSLPPLLLMPILAVTFTYCRAFMTAGCVPHYICSNPHLLSLIAMFSRAFRIKGADRPQSHVRLKAFFSSIFRRVNILKAFSPPSAIYQRASQSPVKRAPVYYMHIYNVYLAASCLFKRILQGGSWLSLKQ